MISSIFSEVLRSGWVGVSLSEVETAKIDFGYRKFIISSVELVA